MRFLAKALASRKVTEKVIVYVFIKNRQIMDVCTKWKYLKKHEKNSKILKYILR